MSGSILGFLALVLLAQAGFVWMRSTRELRTGERRPLVLGVVVAGFGLGLLALARGPGIVGGIAAGLAIGLAGLFLLSGDVLCLVASFSPPGQRVN